MRIGEITRVAVDAVVANKLRSLLTMLGVIIGIASVITMVALGNGAQKSVQDRLGALGTNVLTVRNGQSFQGGVDRGGNRLTAEDAEALAANPRAIAAVAPEMESRLQISYGAGNANLSVVGTWTSYFAVNNHSLGAGRLFTDQESQGRRRVAVIGALVGERLGSGGSESLIGREVQIGGVPFEVVGVLKEKGAAGFANPDEAVYIPLATAQVRVMGSDRLRSIGVQAVDGEQMQAAMAEIDQVLRREHRIRPGEDADFDIRDQATLLSTFQETTKTFTFLLAGVAAVSLLVSVTERTKEIGLRKSLGARRQDVLLQFLIEALVLCLGGGALGLALGAGGSMALQRLAGWNMAISPSSLVLAFGFSAAVGIFFGIWPARRAASLAPIEALRYE